MKQYRMRLLALWVLGWVFWSEQGLACVDNTICSSCLDSEQSSGVECSWCEYTMSCVQVRGNEPTECRTVEPAVPWIVDSGNCSEVEERDFQQCEGAILPQRSGSRKSTISFPSSRLFAGNQTCQLWINPAVYLSSQPERAYFFDKVSVQITEISIGKRESLKIFEVADWQETVLDGDDSLYVVEPGNLIAYFDASNASLAKMENWIGHSGQAVMEFGLDDDPSTGGILSAKYTAWRSIKSLTFVIVLSIAAGMCCVLTCAALKLARWRHNRRREALRRRGMFVPGWRFGEQREGLTEAELSKWTDKYLYDGRHDNPDAGGEVLALGKEKNTGKGELSTQFVSTSQKTTPDVSSRGGSRKMNVALPRWGKEYSSRSKVRIGPKSERLGKHQEEVVVRNELAARINTGECAVCLERFALGEPIRRLMCSHEFHVLCVDQWLATRAEATCPLCKCPVVRRRPLQDAQVATSPGFISSLIRGSIFTSSATPDLQQTHPSPEDSHLDAPSTVIGEVGHESDVNSVNGASSAEFEGRARAQGPHWLVNSMWRMGGNRASATVTSDAVGGSPRSAVGFEGTVV